MDFAHLMHQLESASGVEHLAPNDEGEYVVEFDDWLEVRISQLGRGTVLLQSIVGREPDDEQAARGYLEKVLRYSLMHMKRAADVASLDPDTREVHLHRTMDLDALTPQRLHEDLEQFVNAAEHWSKLLTEDQTSSATPPPMMMLMP